MRLQIQLLITSLGLLLAKYIWKWLQARHAT